MKRHGRASVAIRARERAVAPPARTASRSPAGEKRSAERGGRLRPWKGTCSGSRMCPDKAPSCYPRLTLDRKQKRARKEALKKQYGCWSAAPSALPTFFGVTNRRTPQGAAPLGERAAAASVAKAKVGCLPVNCRGAMSEECSRAVRQSRSGRTGGPATAPSGRTRGLTAQQGAVAVLARPRTTSPIGSSNRRTTCPSELTGEYQSLNSSRPHQKSLGWGSF